MSFEMCQDALRTYLLRKLDFFGKEDRSQITMVATWAAELYLDKVHLVIDNVDISEIECIRVHDLVKDHSH